MSAAALPQPPAVRQTRVVVVDDHPLFREAVVELVDLQSDLKCCGQAGSAPDALEAVRREQPELLLLDLRLGSSDSLELIKALKAQFPALLILVISQYDELLYAERVLRAGARGYLTKEQAGEEMVAAIRTVLRGELYVSRQMAAAVLHKFLEGPPQKPPSGIESLTDRELQVFQLMGAGLATPKIAERLCLSPKTVETHRENIKHKLGLPTAHKLAHFATEWACNSGLAPSPVEPPVHPTAGARA